MEPAHRFRLANTELILASRSVKPRDPSIFSCIKKLLKNSFCWTLADLRRQLNLTDYTKLIQLIDDGLLSANLDNDLLSEPESCYVAENTILLKEAKKLTQHFKLTNTREDTIQSFAKFPPTHHAQAALNRLNRIDSGESSRSVRRWKNWIRKGESEGLSRFQALISKRYLSGNRSRRIPSSAITFLDYFIKDHYAPKQGLSLYRAFFAYKVEAEEQKPKTYAVCWETFRKAVKAIPQNIIAKARGGIRASNAKEAPTDPENRALKANLPWEKAAIDHYLADIYLIHYSDDGVAYAERPWVTAMIDLATKSILAYSISFKNPSRIALARVIRDCVRCHGKLPREIILDRGAEFKSVYCASLFAHYCITHTLRPSGHSRYGGEIEGFFGEFKRLWLTQRPGNLADFKEARSVDGKKAPRTSAVIRIVDFRREFASFINWRDHRPDGIHDRSPYDRFLIGQSEYPFIAKNIDNDQDFKLATCIDESKFAIDPQRGIHIDNLWYSSPELSKLYGQKKKTTVRRDPENPHLIYAQVGHTWSPCFSGQIGRYQALSPEFQISEGIIALDTINLQRSISEQCSMELYRLIKKQKIHSIDNGNSENISSLELPCNPDKLPASDADFFQLVKNTTVIQLKTGTWS